MTDVNEEEVISRHRKERKDLQSQIQALKKSATKGDKKKKKEIAEEIVLLEQQLDQKHSEEWNQFKETTAQITEVSESLNSVSTDAADEDTSHVNQRISKAQKRRDKKANKEKEREELIKAQEKVNIHGARNVETQKIKSILKEQNLMIQEIPSDGNCLYCAVDYHLQHVDKAERGLEKLRALTSQYMFEHMADYLPFLSHPENGDLLTEEQYKEYCDKVANTPAWGGQVELQALSHVLKSPIEVIQAVGPSVLVGEEYKGKRIILSYHRHMYGLGEHYNAVKPYEEPPQEEDL